MKGKRTSSETKAKILETKINNPDLSTREIEQELGIDHSTVSRVINNDLQHVATQSQHVAELIDRNKNLQSLADALIASKLANNEENVRISELVSLRESTFKQNQLLNDKPTDNVVQTVNVSIN